MLVHTTDKPWSCAGLTIPGCGAQTPDQHTRNCARCAFGWIPAHFSNDRQYSWLGSFWPADLEPVCIYSNGKFNKCTNTLLSVQWRQKDNVYPMVTHRRPPFDILVPWTMLPQLYRLNKRQSQNFWQNTQDFQVNILHDQVELRTLPCSSRFQLGWNCLHRRSCIWRSPRW